MSNVRWQKNLLPTAYCLLPALLLSALLLLAGCNVIAALIYKTSGPTPVQPKYVPAKTPLLVMVENFRNPAQLRLDSQRLARQITQEIDRYDIAPTVDPARVEEMSAKPGFSRMTQSAIGKSLGADQVLYINLVKFETEEAVGSEMIKGRAELTVKLVDTKTGQTVWPTDTSVGFPMSIDTPYMKTGETRDEQTLRQQMTTQLAVEIGRLFRKWQPDFEN